MGAQEILFVANEGHGRGQGYIIVRGSGKNRPTIHDIGEIGTLGEFSQDDWVHLFRIASTQARRKLRADSTKPPDEPPGPFPQG
ncbi:MAG: hypothetical protein ACI8UZ_000025 [Akkermansiaceae bacterium]|jgi:hypothetical protein